MTVHIDHDLCSGTRHCTDIAPEIFEVRGGRAWLRRTADRAGDAGLIRAAVRACPWFAIHDDREIDR